MFNKLLIVFSFLGMLCSCIQEYPIDTVNSTHVFVVDGNITNENTPFSVRLYYAHLEEGRQNIIMAEGAIVVIHDDVGNSSVLVESEKGVYIGNVNEMPGVIGRSYWITIERSDGELFESEPEVMNPPVSIDKIYSEEVVFHENNGQSKQAVEFFFDVSYSSEYKPYLRWEYSESWEWHTGFLLPDFTDTRAKSAKLEGAGICYPYRNSSNVQVAQASNVSGNTINKLPITYTTEDEVKLKYKYALESKVYTINKSGYNFWEDIKSNNASSGNMFDAMPTNIIGNITSCSNNCQVVGYFEVSSVDTVSKVFFGEDYSINFPQIDPNCIAGEFCMNKPDTILYNLLSFRINEMGDPCWGAVRSFCSDCTRQYSKDKPQFWLNIEK